MASKKRAKVKAPLLGLIFISVGTSLVIVGFALALIIYYPVILVELGYISRQTQSSQMAQHPLIPVDTDFGIVIPKIGANAKIIANVNPYDSRQYQIALTKGVAHAAGTAYPGQVGNIFLFSHSSANFYEASRYNSIFFLLSKLEKNDHIDLYYKGQKFTYRVSDKKIVGADSVQYLTGETTKKTLTLMTCWPPGTTYKRLIVLAEISPEK